MVVASRLLLLSVPIGVAMGVAGLFTWKRKQGASACPFASGKSTAATVCPFAQGQRRNGLAALSVACGALVATAPVWVPLLKPLQVYNFTPLNALLGGLLLGVATLMKVALKGEVLGISGILKGLVQGNALEPQRWCFVIGMLLCSCALQFVYPGAFGEFDIPLVRLLVAGLLIGSGSALGNGCTSGHGICGNARLSPRSMVYTGVFMLAGFVTATLARSTEAFATFPRNPQATLADTASSAFMALALHLLMYFLSVVLAPERMAALMTDVLDGSLFAFGLGISGMTNPSKVVEFLDLHNYTWNPTLMLVMGGALGVVAPFIQLVVRPRRLAAPVLSSQFKLPTRTDVDRRLLAGGVLFGVGWGLAGICPGPSMVNVCNPYSSPAAFIAAMFAGFALVGAIDKSCGQTCPATVPLSK